MLKSPQDFYSEIYKSFAFSPTSKQNRLLKMLSIFLMESNPQSLFLLKGFAGTGKTSVVGTLVSNLHQINRKSILMAPTGRAAKVMAKYSRRKAYTIHKKIYFPKRSSSAGMEFVLQTNKHTNTVFIVDEASMIADARASTNLFAGNSLLDDLLSYVYSGKNCKLILIGDTAQLPPVKLNLSPALNANELESSYHMEVSEIELDQVMRQSQDSGILVNATNLRNAMNDHLLSFAFQLDFPDIIRLEDGYDIEDAIVSAYDNKDIEDNAFIVRSNKRANLYNKQIRLSIRGMESEISGGDYVMIVKNNYYWLDNSSEAGFIANGDICKVLKVFKIIDLYGFTFAEVELQMIDYPNMSSFETVLILNTLTSESPSLTYEESNRLYESVKEDYQDIKSKYKQFLAIKSNKYFNALQVKYAYAITCHKSQGGQWANVFIEQPYLPEGVSLAYYRWLYTAVTRAQEKLYLIGFKDDFFTD